MASVVLISTRKLSRNMCVRFLHHRNPVNRVLSVNHLGQLTNGQEDLANKLTPKTAWLNSYRCFNLSSSLRDIVKVPPFADSVSEGDVIFTVKVGDEVAADEKVMEIETDKTTVGVPTPVSGVIEEIYVKDGDTVKPGQDLFKIKPKA